MAYVALLALLTIDCFVNFHKGYYAFGYGKVVDDKRLIIKRYLRTYFIPDIICNTYIKYRYRTTNHTTFQKRLLAKLPPADLNYIVVCQEIQVSS